MTIQSLGVQTTGYKPSINAPKNNTTFTGATPDSPSDTYVGETKKKEKSFIARLLTNLTIASVATIAISFGLAKFHLAKNLKALSKKVGESPTNEIKKHLNGYSLTSKRQITTELVKNDTFNNTSQNKIKDVITQISSDGNLPKESVIDRIINKLNDILQPKNQKS